MKKQELTHDHLQNDMHHLKFQSENDKNNRLRKYWIDISNFIEGKASLNAYIVNLHLIILLLVLTLVIPALLFPTYYSMRTNTISDLGVYSKNPQGAPIFNIGMIIIGFLLIPFSMKLYQIIEKRDSKLAKNSRSIYLSISLGFIIVGIFPSNHRIPHLIGATLVFFGYILVINIDRIILIRKRKRSKEIKKETSDLGIFYKTFNLIALQFGISLIFSLFNPFNNYGFMSSSLWEWIFFLTIMSWDMNYFINISKTEQNKSKKLNSFFGTIEQSLAKFGEKSKFLLQKSKSPHVH